MKHPHYEIGLHLSPRLGELRARVELTCSLEDLDAEPSSDVFFLHRSLRPETVTGDDVIGFTWGDMSTPHPLGNDMGWAELTVSYGKAAQLGKTRRLVFEYRGCPGIVSQWQVNRLTPEWVELGMYAPWFPFRLDWHFTYRVSVTVDPGYETIGVGMYKSPDGQVTLASTEPTRDIVVVCAPRFLTEQRAVAHDSVRVRFTSENDAGFAKQIAEDGAWVLDFLGSWLGRSMVKPPEIVIAPRTTGGAYVRPGLVVMSRPEGDPASERQRYFRWVAHEFGHLWWFRASFTNWEDWLNESFAEFCSLASLRQKYGEDAYASRLNDMRHRSQDLPPVRGLPRNHEKASDVLYVKGCVILADLEMNIGRELMTRFLQEVYSQEAVTTEAVIQVLNAVAGPTHGQWLDERLRS